MDHSMAELSARERRFVAEYQKDRNGTQAAIRAGYSKKTARRQASRLLTKDHIRAAVEEKLAKVESKLDMSAERIHRELAAMGFINAGDFLTFEEITVGNVKKKLPRIDLEKCTREQLAGLAGFDLKNGKVTLEKRAALMDLAKLLGYVRDRVDVSVFDHEGYLREIHAKRAKK